MERGREGREGRRGGDWRKGGRYGEKGGRDRGMKEVRVVSRGGDVRSRGKLPII